MLLGGKEQLIPNVVDSRRHGSGLLARRLPFTSACPAEMLGQRPSLMVALHDPSRGDHTADISKVSDTSIEETPSYALSPEPWIDIESRQPSDSGARRVRTSQEHPHDDTVDLGDQSDLT